MQQTQSIVAEITPSKITQIFYKSSEYQISEQMNNQVGYHFCKIVKRNPKKKFNGRL